MRVWAMLNGTVYISCGRLITSLGMVFLHAIIYGWLQISRLQKHHSVDTSYSEGTNELFTGLIMIFKGRQCTPHTTC